MSRSTKFQKNFNLSEISVERFIPALKRAFGTYTTMADVAFATLYFKTVAEATDIEEALETVESWVDVIAEDLSMYSDSVEFRFAPDQKFSDMPRWAHIQVASRTSMNSWQAMLEGHDLTVFPEVDNTRFYVSVRTEGLLKLATEHGLI